VILLRQRKIEVKIVSRGCTEVGVSSGIEDVTKNRKKEAVNIIGELGKSFKDMQGWFRRLQHQ